MVYRQIVYHDMLCIVGTSRDTVIKVKRTKCRREERMKEEEEQTFTIMFNSVDVSPINH